MLLLTLILYFKPINGLENVSKSSQSVMIALNADQRSYPSRNTPGFERSFCQTTNVPPYLKAKVICQALNLTLTASTLVLLAGDVSENPGPVKDACGVCLKGCRKNQKAIQCDDCDVWFHAKCSGVTDGEYANLSVNSNTNWYCFKCVFPFELNDCNGMDVAAGVGQIPNNDVFEGTCSLRRGFKIAHLNINRLINKMDRIRELIIQYKFDVLALNETFLTSDIDDSELYIPGYKLARKDRTNSAKLSGGGVMIYIRDCIPFVTRTDLMHSETELYYGLK